MGMPLSLWLLSTFMRESPVSPTVAAQRLEQRQQLGSELSPTELRDAPSR